MMKQYCEEMHNYYGFPDHKYGGCLVDLGDLKEGTVFFVCNGAWHGKIELVKGVKSVMLTTRHKHSIPSKSAQLSEDVLGPAKENYAFIAINDSSDLEYIKTFFDEDVDIEKYSRRGKVQPIAGKPFIEACLSGEALPTDISDYVEYWHTHEVDEASLRDFLGFTPEEYQDFAVPQFIKDEQEFIQTVLKCRKAGIPYLEYVKDEEERSER